MIYKHEFVEWCRVAMQRAVLASDEPYHLQAATRPHEVRGVGAFYDRLDTATSPYDQRP